MYQISIKNDSDTPIMFLDSLTFIPALYEGSTYIDEAKQETFVIRFNKHYSKIAYKKKIQLDPKLPAAYYILVPDLYDETKMGENPDPPQEKTKEELKEMVDATFCMWKKFFGIRGNDLKVAFKKLMKKRFIIK